MTIFLTAMWVLLATPNPSASVANPREFEIERVAFESLEDCDAAGRKWMNDLAVAAMGDRGKLSSFGVVLNAPDDVSVTFSCVERDR